MRSESYQLALIFLGIVATAFFGVFFYRELFPEYRIYQNDYIALEKFRSTYSGEPPPVFREGVKQIVFEREDKGPPNIDRCTSCHVALQLPHFSPTKIQQDANGTIVRDTDGLPVKVPNENYIWAKLDHKIAELKDSQVLKHLEAQGEKGQIKSRLAQANELESLKTAKVGDHVYDISKVLVMHPLIGKETRPFEYHSVDEYGCTSCHGGNGKGLTADKAHGPVFDDDYEAEFMGPRPEFLESDKDNDPAFARMFNHKPGDALLFQTTPILVRHLIQAKCIQCHRVEDIQTSLAKAAGDEKVVSSGSGVDLLTKDYHRGEQLYISQACYACHRIAGLSRGGVGPELTRAGGLYPWYMKEKLTWPQGSLKTSRMPNMILDHMEVEDLMTFLLGQKGPGRAVSEIDYKVAMQKWEAGSKMTWEKSIPSSKLHDLRFAMTVFATEGCAACHRLEGFESDVGYRIEKAKEKSPFEALYKEREWFRKMFPEDIAGTEIVQAIESHGEEIDRHIADDIRQGSILEEIEKKYPDTIESFYANFRFAYRAKNHLYDEKAKTSSDAKQKTAALANLDEWKKRVHRVLMMYIQEYGLGRLIGPRPNWSGVYRGDEWLMEHFRNPAGHVPNSIMPIFPFDDSKFYALIYMLDEVGKHNRDKVRAIWEHRGFDPGQAYEIHCAQCHGDYLQGNGPVSVWIYPIPKNLHNVEFVRNLTKENAIQSITHGVKGTPMAPWGETPKDKYHYDGIAVLNDEEIKMLVDWIYGSIPGSVGMDQLQDIPKWQYSPKDVIEELRNEKGKLNAVQERGQNMQSSRRSTPYSLSFSRLDERLYADLNPKVVVTSKEDPDREVESIFDVIKNPILGQDKNLYYIKKKYYTQENIEQGKRFFEANCAVCHGADADGAGVRASIMLDAKPRMLINLDWIKMRDDMRLLRSIKYGVPGTAMTPWGDLTSSLQRLQLVIFIRSLNQENEFREDLSTSLFRAFDQNLELLDQMRASENAMVIALNSQINELQQKQQSILDQSHINTELSEKAVDLYKQQIELTSRLKRYQEVDQLLLDMMGQVKKESNLYREIGMDFNRAGIDGADWNLYLNILKLNDGRVAISDGALVFKSADLGAIQEKIDLISKNIDTKIASLEKQKIATQGKIGSEKRTEELKTLDAQIGTLTKSKRRLLSGWEEIKEINKREYQFFKTYQQKKVVLH